MNVVSWGLLVQLVIGPGEKSIELIALYLNVPVEGVSEVSFITFLLLVELGLPVTPSLELAKSQAVWSADHDTFFL
jgi:hypothetical protein